MSKQQKPKPYNPFVQSLEARKLLSAVLTDGVLTVTGTSKKDDIVVSLSKDGETVTVSETKSTRFKKGKAVKTTFDAADVSSIIVNAGEGNDNVSIRGAKGTAFEVDALLNGEAGNDRLSGAAGNDSLNGGDGDDDLFGAAGTDLLEGGAGDDALVGGDDIDTLNGGDGDDLLKSAGDEAIDILDGGADSSTDDDAADDAEDADIALIDDDETAINAAVTDPDDVLPPGGGHGGPGGPGGGGPHGGPGRGGPGGPGGPRR